MDKHRDNTGRQRANTGKAHVGHRGPSKTCHGFLSEWHGFTHSCAKACVDSCVDLSRIWHGFGMDLLHGCGGCYHAYFRCFKYVTNPRQIHGKSTPGGESIFEGKSPIRRHSWTRRARGWAKEGLETHMRCYGREGA